MVNCSEALAARYCIEETRVGGEAVIFKAVQHDSKRVVAIKKPSDIVLHDSKRLNAFVEEAERMSRFKNEHIVEVIHFYRKGEIDENCYLVMEWMDQTLADLLEHVGPSPEAALAILQKIAQGVNVLHRGGIIHRDLKPQNIFVSADASIIKIGDLGIASEVGVDQTIKSTPKYVAPEVYKSDQTIGYRADIYSLGMIAYQMFLGNDRFQKVFSEIYSSGSEKTRNARWLNWHLDSTLTVPKLQELRNDIPERISSIVVRMMSKNQEERFSDADSLFLALSGREQNYTAAADDIKPLPLDDEEHQTKKAGTVTFGSAKMMIWTSVFGLLVILATVGVILLTGKSSGDPQSMIIAKNAAIAADEKATRAINDHQGIPSIEKAEDSYKKAHQEFNRAEGKEKENLLESEKTYKNAKELFNKSRVEVYKQASGKAREEADEALDKMRKHEGRIYAKAKTANSEMEVANKFYKAAGLENIEIAVAIEKYNSAKSKFNGIAKDFLLIIDAVRAKDNALKTFGQARKQGLSKDELQEGKKIANTGVDNLGAEKFKLATHGFEEAIRQFEIAMEAHKKASALVAITVEEPTEQISENIDAIKSKNVIVMLGSTPEQVQFALDLCSKYQKNCLEKWYGSESLREVTLTPVDIDRYEVTVRQFAEFAQATGYKTDAEKKGYSERWTGGLAPEKAKGYSWKTPDGPNSTYLNKLDHPVGYISWNDANAYCQFVGKRLPTEDEWEFAARGIERYIFPWGNQWIQSNVQLGGLFSQPIGSYPKGATKTGFHDLAGSVWEWTATRIGLEAVLKGGSRAETNPANLRAAMQRLEGINASYHDDGFRCLQDVEK